MVKRNRHIRRFIMVYLHQKRRKNAPPPFSNLIAQLLTWIGSLIPPSQLAPPGTPIISLCCIVIRCTTIPTILTNFGKTRRMVGVVFMRNSIILNIRVRTTVAKGAGENPIFVGMHVGGGYGDAKGHDRQDHQDKGGHF